MVKIEHPHYIKYIPDNGNVVLLPYCLFTDETFFEFKKDKLDFLSTCSSDISNRFLDMLEQKEASKYLKSVAELDNTLDKLEAAINSKSESIPTFIEGNDTIH